MAEGKKLLLWVQTFVIVGLLTGFLVVIVPNAPGRTSSARKIGDIKLRSNSLFRFKRELKDECLWELVAQGAGSTLTSPNYPENYPNDADCLWLITAEDPNATISLKIEDLNIEPHRDCRLDFLQVYLGATVESAALGPFCGNVYNRLIETNSSEVLLLFHSDRVYQDKGFSIDYFTDRAGDCLESVTEAFGSLRSPGFPDNYPDESDCTTLIEVPEDRKVILNFDTVDLEVGDDCSFDYVQIFDGKTKNSTLLGQICQQTDVRSFESSASSLLVHFHSDNLVNKKGYRARYTSVDRRSTPIGDCQWEPEIDNGTISSPNYPENYPSPSNCSIWILAPEDSFISINIEASLMEIDYNCSFDFLLISEGSSSASRVLGRFCGKPSEPRQINSTQSEVLVHFESDDYVEFSGFRLTYRFVEKKKEIVRERGTGVTPAPFDGTLAFSVTPMNVTLSKGSSAMLHCKTNHPEAKIRWLKGHIFLGGEDLLPGLSLLPNDTLWIRSMHRQLAGVYTCVVVAPEGELATAAYAFMTDETSVNESCEIEFQEAPSDSEFEEGGFGYLKCRATGDRTTLSWEKDGVPLRLKDHVTNRFIAMDRVRLEDAGLYTCVATDGSCVKRASAVLKVVQRVKIEEICGRSKVDLSPRRKLQNEHGKIVGGYDAPKGAYPWQVMLWEPKLKSFCGATLLNERWIATAAHCLKNAKHDIAWDSVRIFLGKHDRESRDREEVGTRIASPSDVVYHPKFVRYTFDNDLALVRMADRVPFTDHILPVCLGDRNASERLLLGENGTRMGTVVGWGKLRENGPSPRYLQEIKLPLVDQDVCRASTDFLVTHNMFCAGYSQEVIGDACYGDSGGPFLMSHEGRWYMVGIVSWGEGCGKKNKYGFYTRIANHLSWIQSVIKS